MITINEKEAQAQLPRLLSMVSKGEEIIISAGNKPLAKIVPFSSPVKKRTAGLSRGKIQVGVDFDEPLPDEFWAGAE